MACYVVPTLIFTVFPLARDFLGSLQTTCRVSFRVKGQSQTPSHSPVYSGVAEAAVQSAVGVIGGVTSPIIADTLGDFFSPIAALWQFRKVIVIKLPNLMG